MFSPCEPTGVSVAVQFIGLGKDMYTSEMGQWIYTTSQYTQFEYNRLQISMLLFQSEKNSMMNSYIFAQDNAMAKHL